MEPDMQELFNAAADRLKSNPEQVTLQNIRSIAANMMGFLDDPRKVVQPGSADEDDLWPNRLIGDEAAAEESVRKHGVVDELGRISGNLVLCVGIHQNHQ